MDTPTLRKRVNQLQNEINPYTEKKVSKAIKFSFERLNTSPKLYIGIALLIFLIMIVTKPSFVKVTVRNKTKISIAKFLTYWFVFVLVFWVGIFAYNYKSQM